MVLRNRDRKMASEQPVKKKLRITDDEDTRDETDFINADNMMRTDLSRLHLTLPQAMSSTTTPPINEESFNVSTNSVLHKQNVNLVLNRTLPMYDTTIANQDSVSGSSTNYPFLQNGVHLSLQPGFSVVNNVPKQVNVPPPDNSIYINNPLPSSLHFNNASNTSTTQLVPNTINIFNNINLATPWVQQQQQQQRICASDQIVPSTFNMIPEQFDATITANDEIENLQNSLIRQCLCGVSESTLRKPFETSQCRGEHGIRTAMLSEWPVPKTLQFLSNVQLLFDVYLKQNNKGDICSRICDICDYIVRNEQNLIDQIIDLGNVRNKYINYLSARVLSSFLIMAKTNINNEWLEIIVGYLATEPVDYVKMNFSLEVIKRVVDWKDVDIHVLEESEATGNTADGASTSRLQESEMIVENTTCSKVSFTDHESFDTTGIKGLIIKSLEAKWPSLIKNIQLLIIQNPSIQSQNCVLTFLSLWESIISVRANLSVVDTKPFYAHLENFVMLLNHSLPAIVWRQLLSLFNEVLCYGSTLALQDMLPEIGRAHV